MKVTTQLDSKTTVVSRIAGEDIACGDFVAVMNEIVELPSFFWSDSAVSLSPDETVSVRYMPRDAGQPFKVIGVCLPFVYVKSCNGAVSVFDMRRRQLVRLDATCSRHVWKHMKSPRRKSN